MPDSPTVGDARQACINAGGHFWTTNSGGTYSSPCMRCGYNPRWVRSDTSDTAQPVPRESSPPEPPEAQIESVASIIRHVWLTDAEGVAAMEDEARNIARDILSRLQKGAEDVKASELRAGDRIAVRVDQVLWNGDVEDYVLLVGVEAPSRLIPDQMVTRVRG